MIKKSKSLLVSGMLSISMGINIPISFADSNNITPAQLKTYIDKADDYMIFANKVNITADTEGNIATKEAILKSNIGLTDNVTNINPNANQISYIERFSDESKMEPFRNGSKILLDENKNTIGDTDNGNSWSINNIKVGPKNNISLFKITDSNKIDINKELTENLTNASTKLMQLNNSTKFKVYTYTAEDISDANKTINLESGDTDSIKNNIIVNIKTDGKSAIEFKAKVSVDGVRDNWKSVSSKVLYNFCNSDGTPYNGKIITTDLLMGSILAPQADVQVGGGNVNGSIFCDEFLGNNSEVHKIDFVISEKGDTPTTPEKPDTPNPEEPDIPTIELPEDTNPPQTGDYFSAPYIIGAIAIVSTLFVINKKSKVAK